MCILKTNEQNRHPTLVLRNAKHISVKEQRFTNDTELLTVNIRPYYLTREFSHDIVINVYVPPSANATAACDLVYTVVC